MNRLCEPNANYLFMPMINEHPSELHALLFHSRFDRANFATSASVARVRESDRASHTKSACTCFESIDFVPQFGLRQRKLQSKSGSKPSMNHIQMDFALHAHVEMAREE